MSSLYCDLCKKAFSFADQVIKYSHTISLFVIGQGINSQEIIDQDDKLIYHSKCYSKCYNIDVSLGR